MPSKAQRQTSTRSTPLSLLFALACVGCNREPSPTAIAPKTIAERNAPHSHLGLSERQWNRLPRSTRSSEGFIWFEAEDNSSTNFPTENPFAPENSQEASALSGGKWIGASNTTEPLFAEYKINVPGDGEFTLYARKFWKHGPFRFRFDEQVWQNCDRETPLLDSVGLRPSVGVNWVEAGVVRLAGGPHTLRLELNAPTNAAAFDAFVLAQDTFLPRGKYKPTDTVPSREPGWFAFDPALDDFAPSPLDLRRLNEEEAGSRGFLRANNGELSFSNSKDLIRFWGNNASLSVLELSDSALRRYSRNLAKKGINLLRLHGPVFDQGNFRKLPASQAEKIQRLAAALREHGVYLGLSVYFPLWLELGPEDGFAGYKNQVPFALHYFSKDFQKIYLNWWRELLTAPNPHGGPPLAKDPSVAYVELLNEDSTLFWTFSPYEAIPEEQTILFEKRFGSWLSERHGSVQAALERWGGKAVRGDLPEESRAGFLPLWNIVNDESVRAKETAEFLTRLMRENYSSWSRTIKEEIGYKGLIVCSNWHTADEKILGPLDNWANSACDIMDRHGYFSGKHEGQTASYSVDVGHRYEDDSALIFQLGKENSTAEFRLPFLEPRYNDKPAFASELGWPWPNRFRTEGPLLTAGYGALNGLDGAMFFASDDLGWASSMAKFSVMDPAFAGQYPAAALIFRNGLVKEAEPVARVSLAEEKLFSLNAVPFIGPPSFDSLRLKDIPALLSGRKSDSEAGTLAQLIGPVNFYLGSGANAAHDFQADLSPWLDREHHRIKSRTGELSWDSARGVVRIVAPQAEAAFGFLKRAGPLKLATLSATFENEYASVALVALDGKPLHSSKKMLLQIGTEAKNSGWSAPGTGFREIKAVGELPFLVREAQGAIQLHRPDAQELLITALDPNGKAITEPLKGVARVSLLPDVLYYVIEAPSN